ncbi:hypothetical protein Tco_1424391, partial [Tanacetum coccineum]
PMIVDTALLIVDVALLIVDTALIPGFFRGNRRQKTDANDTRDHACTQTDSRTKRMIKRAHSEFWELILKESLNYYGGVAVVDEFEL